MLAECEPHLSGAHVIKHLAWTVCPCRHETGAWRSLSRSQPRSM